MSNYGNAYNYYMGGGNVNNNYGGGTFSDGSSSNPTTNMNTPYTN